MDSHRFFMMVWGEGEYFLISFFNVYPLIGDRKKRGRYYAYDSFWTPCVAL